jgi:hypothetical protein
MMGNVNSLVYRLQKYLHLSRGGLESMQVNFALPQGQMRSLLAVFPSKENGLEKRRKA